MQQATIRDNIVCCEPWNAERYNQVIFACALKTDLAIMPLGDATPVAEKGISLSGGQRQRIALARAVYRIADVYLLDNPISALDDQTQQHIWTHLFEGMLQSVTVIVGSSRPVISCSAVLHLSPSGVCADDSAVSWFNGPVAAPAASNTPPRYSKAPQTAVPDAAAMFTPQLNSSNLTAFDAADISRSSRMEDASVADVTADVREYERYVHKKSSKGLRSSGQKLPSFFNSFDSRGSATGAGVESSFESVKQRSMRTSYANFVTGFEDKSEYTAGRLETSASRMHSLFSSIENSVTTPSYIADSSTKAPLLNMKEFPESAAAADAAFKTITSKQPPAIKHGLRHWAQAGGLPFFVLVAVIFPMPQVTRIVCDQFLRWWSDDYFLWQQKEYFAVYLYLSGG
jgi:hypothetical protein